MQKHPEYHVSLSSNATTGNSLPQLIPNGYNNALQIYASDGAYNFGTTPYEVALRSLNIFYSFPTFLSTASFQYVFPVNTSGGPTTYTINIPTNSYYTIEQLNGLIQYSLLGNGLYLVDASGNSVYYLSVVVNSTTYNVNILAPVVPLSLPTGYTNPAGMPFATVANSNMQLILTDPQVLRVLGYVAGTYPSTPTGTGGNYSGAGTNSPEVCPYSSIYVWVSTNRNTYFTWPPQIYSFSIGDTQYAKSIQVEPKVWSFSPCLLQAYPSLTLELRDEKGNPLVVRDTNWSADLIYRPVKN